VGAQRQWQVSAAAASMANTYMAAS